MRVPFNIKDLLWHRGVWYNVLMPHIGRSLVEKEPEAAGAFTDLWSCVIHGGTS